MAKCTDCLHCGVCAHRYERLCKGTKVEDLNHACTKFKDSTNYVEVVRCEDCKHYRTSGCAMDTYAFDVVEEGFCSYGERRADG